MKKGYGREVKKTEKPSTEKKLPNLRLAQELAERMVSRVIAKAQMMPSLRRLGPSGSWQVEVKIVGAASMKSLNTEYRGKKRTTDVLSFPSPSVFFDRGVLGQVVVCLPVLRKQAKEVGHSDQSELVVLLVHGLLHLLGLDHEESAQKKKQMQQLEELLLLAVGMSGRQHPVHSLIKRNSSIK